VGLLWSHDIYGDREFADGYGLDQALHHAHLKEGVFRLTCLKYLRNIIVFLIVSYILILIVWPQGLVTSSDSEVIEILQGCSHTKEILGDNAKVLYERSIATAGVWFPPVEGCTKFTTVQGDKGTVKFYQGSHAGGSCFHVRHNTGEMKKTGHSSESLVNVIDLNSGLVKSN
jgi:hypothetical protein